MNKKSKEYKTAERGAKAILIDVGLMYNTSRQVQESTIIRKIGGLKKRYFDRTPKYGERAWKAVGKKKTLILWDCGNGWYQIVKEVKK